MTDISNQKISLRFNEIVSFFEIGMNFKDIQFRKVKIFLNY